MVRHPHRGGVERVGHVASCGGGPVQQLEVLEGVVRTRQFPRDTQCVELRLRQDILREARHLAQSHCVRGCNKYISKPQG